jgi:hypothetical protein
MKMERKAVKRSNYFFRILGVDLALGVNSYPRGRIIEI